MTISSLANVFSRATFRVLASGDPLSADTADLLVDAKAAAKRRVEADGQAGVVSLGDVFDEALRQLAVAYRCEYVYKAQVVSKLVFGRHSPRTASAHIELPMGAAVADVLIVNGTTSVYEIKTDLDNFDRLDDQLGEYRSRAEFTNVVVSERRARDAARVAPTWVGIVALRRNGALSTVRAACSMARHISPEHQFAMLRLNEALRAVRPIDEAWANVPTALLHPLVRDAFCELGPVQSNAAVVAAMRERGRAVQPLVAQPEFPRSLRALAYAQPLTRAAQARLLARLTEVA